MSDEDFDKQEMRNALSAIANEMQNFQNESLPFNETQDDLDLTTTLTIQKCLKLKKEQIKMLRRNLKSACSVAKTLSAAKETETASLNNQLNCARNQYWDLVSQDKEKTNIINSLKAENQTLQDKLKCFNNFIRLGYQELQNTRNESVEEISSLKQLQTIISCTGQYYANQHKQYERYAQLEQKNRFLTSKLHILERQLETTSEELRSLRLNTKTLNRRDKEDETTKDRISRNIGIVYSEYQIGNLSKLTNLKMTNMDLSNHSMRSSRNNLDLTRHLSTVKKLLHDQDTLINDLKCLSKEIKSDVFMG